MMTKALFYRLQVPYGFTLEERHYEMSSLAACCLQAYVQGEREEKLFNLHSMMEVIDEPTYNALFDLYALIEERIREDMAEISLTYPLMESEAPYALFRKGFTAFVLDSKKLMLERIEKLRALLKEDLQKVSGLSCQKKGLTLQANAGLKVVSIDFKEACAFVKAYHRHQSRCTLVAGPNHR